MKKYAALDLDRTVFKTKEFTNDISLVGADLAGIDVSRFVQDSQQFRQISKERLSHYDFFAQLESYGVSKNKKTIERITAMIIATKKSYVYDDASEFLSLLIHKQYNPFVLTYGESVYQSLKVAICPELNGVPVAVVQQPKRIHLASIGESGVLFDDVVQDILPKGWRSELIDRQMHPTNALLRLSAQL